MLDGVCNDLRFAIRQLVKSKGFTVTATLTLALGIGANTAIFTLVHAVMLKSLPVADPASLYRLGDSDNCCVIGGYQASYSIFSYPLYTYLRERMPEFEQAAAFQAGLARVGVRRGAGPSEPFLDQFVSGNYFSTFGIKPFVGRLLEPSDDQRGAPPVAVISYRAWDQHYGADLSLIGQTMVIDGAPFTIVGIAPRGFFGDTLRPNPPDFWLPLASEPGVRRQNSLLDSRDEQWVYIVGRLKAGVQIGPLEGRINVDLLNWMMANVPPKTEPDRRDVQKQHITIAPAGSGNSTMKANYASDLRLLMGITGLVLVIACANLANLLLARGMANAAQTSIRAALGAPRGRLVRQTLVESVLVAFLGGAAGLLVAVEVAELLLHLAFRDARNVPIDAAPSWPVMGFAFLLSLATGIVFGLVPAWSGSRSDPAAALRGAGRSTGSRGTLPQKSLIVVQAALSLVLLAGAGLMVETLRNLTNQKFGYQSEGRYIVNVNAAFGGYAPEKLAAIYGEIERKMKQTRGVRTVSLSLYSPMEGNNWQSGIHTEERPDQLYSPSWVRVSSRFFETIGARILRGRMFDERDTPDATHVAVVNQAFADRMFSNEDPIGKRFGLGEVEHRTDYQVIGVVENVRFRRPRQPTPPMFFLPLLQMWPQEWADSGKARSNIIGNIELQVAGKASDLAPQVQRTLAEIDPKLTMLEIRTIDEQLGSLLSHERLIASLAQLFGLLALALASVGLYGITAYSVARRTSEIGIRSALGADRGGIVRMILKGALGQIALGLALGIPASLAAGRALAGQLYGVKSYDPWVLGGASLLLVGCACAAAIGPAVRASGVDPVRALRGE